MSPRPDDDPEKRRMKGQTEVKHEILGKYLRPWLFKITEMNPNIQYIDGFAGWGRYSDGSPGSPLIAMQVVEKNWDTLKDRGKLTSIDCIFVEPNDNNRADLKEAVRMEEGEISAPINITFDDREFEEFAREFIEEYGDEAPPSFIFVDPFGFSGLPFEVVRDIMSLRSSGMELFITFMSGKMARFMQNPEHRKAITEILGSDSWESEISTGASKEERAEQFVHLYEKQLRQEAGVEYVWPFQMYEESKTQTTYYLIHATNHFDGFKLMKDIMFKAGAGEQFAYLGPDHYPFEAEQTNLGDWDAYDESEERIQDLAHQLHDELVGKTMTFRAVMEATYEDTTLIEKHYRSACKFLADNGLADIHNRPDMNNGTKTGLNDDDRVEFRPGGLSHFTS